MRVTFRDCHGQEGWVSMGPCLHAGQCPAWLVPAMGTDVMLSPHVWLRTSIQQEVMLHAVLCSTSAETVELFACQVLLLAEAAIVILLQNQVPGTGCAW